MGCTSSHISCSSKEKHLYPFLSTGWIGSILPWSQKNLKQFSSHLTAKHLEESQEVRGTGSLIVLEGEVELYVCVPGTRRDSSMLKTLVCKKGKGDMIHIDIAEKFWSSPSNDSCLEALREDIPKMCASENSLTIMNDYMIIKSITCSTLLQIDWNSLMDRFKKNQLGFDINLLRTIGNTNLLLRYLTTMPVIKNFPCCDLELLGSMCDFSFFKSGTTIYTEGDDGDEAYIILSGVVFAASSECGLLSNEDQSASSKMMMNQTRGQTLTEGQYFGQISPFLPFPRRESITAMTDVVLASLSKKSICSLQHKVNEFFLRRFILEEYLKYNSPFIDKLQDSAVDMIAKLMMIEIVEEGHKVVTEGDQADRCYFVFHGHCSMKIKRGNQLDIIDRSIHAGEYFGELALVEGVRLHAMSVVSLAKSVFLVLSRENFAKCLQQFPQLRAELTIKFKGSSSELKDILDCEKTRDAFYRFLQSEQKLNILTSHDTINEIKSALNHNHEVIEMLTNFADTFLKPKSPKFIEVPKNQLMIFELDLRLMTKGVGEHSDSIQVKHGILDSIHKYIHQTLETDLLPRFKISMEWAKLCRDFNLHNNTACLPAIDLSIKMVPSIECNIHSLIFHS
mmetsp:Transcript_14135/g.26517  ORF Transcript_14135/g.26517 Transcript_14135/m.26517 type:complete len:622 (+) Transcript_14135:228-2093(+)